LKPSQNVQWFVLVQEATCGVQQSSADNKILKKKQCYDYKC